jgi:putative addiction module CopG family antidote
MDIEIEAGRPFAVVSESTAREYWPGSRAVGQTLTGKERSLTVVGVVEEARFGSQDETRESLMNVTIPKSLEALIRQKVEEGHYSTEDEVVADALRLMQARDEVAEIKRTRLKDAIERGYEEVATGKVIRLETDDQIDEFFADL